MVQDISAADDYAIRLVTDKISQSLDRQDALILVIEDEVEDGGDPVDAHRSTAFVIGMGNRDGRTTV